ncbi:helix-turn-helix transcriptional regulator [Paenibacillus sp. NRS-1775]|uniref:helix-turn-helix domain-containing protein n=1 Tax=unclassified Paenibacillus TaxID=185978 RepID=UPI003D28C3B3
MSEETLGERINFIRTKRMIRISELAEMIKIPVFDKSGNVIDYKSYTKTSLSLIENNKQRPSIDVVTAISDILGVSIDWLARGVEYEGEKMLSLSQEKLQFHLEITGEEKLNSFEKLVKEMRDSLKIYDDKIKELEKYLPNQSNSQNKEDA